jgi:hypothetical protein
MSGSDHRVIRDLGSFGRLWWLPAGGRGNGLDDASWLAVLDVDGDVPAAQILDAMHAAHVPAYAAHLTGAAHAGAPRFERLRGEPVMPVRIWVGSTRFGMARDVLLVLLPEIIRTHGEGAIL